MTTVDLSGVSVDDIDEKLEQQPLSDIVNFIVGGSDLYKIPDQVMQMQNLKSLDVSGNYITELPDWLNRLSHLNQLILNDNSITSISSTLTDMRQIRQLDLSENQISHLPDFTSMSGLEELTIHTNKIVDLTGAITPNLRSLVAYSNKIDKLPPELFLTTLEYLDLGNNKITLIPSEIERCTALRSLSFSHNPLSLPLTVDFRQFASLSVLGLDRLGLDQIPDEISVEHLPALKELWMAGNRLTEIPESICHLPLLEAIDFSRNDLTIFTLKEYISLVDLNLSHNHIAEFHIADVDIEFPLIKLDLSFNRLDRLPESTGESLNNLSQFMVQNNQLNRLPDSMSIMDNLHTLNLENNQLTDLFNMQRLFGLRVLSLNYNPLPETVIHRLQQELNQREELMNNEMRDQMLNAIEVHKSFYPALDNAVQLIPLLSRNNKMSVAPFFTGDFFSGDAVIRFAELYEQPVKPLEPLFQAIQHFNLNLPIYKDEVETEYTFRQFFVASILFGHERTSLYKERYIQLFQEECLNAYPDNSDDARISCPKGIMERFIITIAQTLKIEGETSIRLEVDPFYSEKALLQICDYIMPPEPGLTFRAINNLYASGCASTDEFDAATTVEVKKGIFKRCVLEAYEKNGGEMDKQEDRDSAEREIDRFIADENNSVIFYVYEG